MGVSLKDCSIRAAEGMEVRQALLLVLSHLAPESRAALIDSLKRQKNTKLHPLSTLWIVEHQKNVIAACWAQPQSGNAATLWPPVVAEEVSEEVITELVKQVMSVVDVAGIRFTQLLLEEGDDSRIKSLEASGFEFVAKLEYLGRKTQPLSSEQQGMNLSLNFRPFGPDEQDQLKQIVESTYVETLDCPSLTGLRDIEDTLEGYRSTGKYLPKNWFCIQSDQEDIGVLILAELEMGENYELVYMGILPQYRGKGYGSEIVEFACQTAAKAGADQIMVAVDDLNLPAKKAYQNSGFVPWANRWAYVRSGAAS